MRYSGSSLAYQFAAILGGMAPLICTALVAITGGVYSVAAFVSFGPMVSFACSYLMTETLRTGLRNDEPFPGGLWPIQPTVEPGLGSREHIPRFRRRSIARVTHIRDVRLWH